MTATAAPSPAVGHPLAGQAVHFNGLGGKGIAPAAALALAAGMTVSGDDLSPNHRTSALAAAGADVTVGSNRTPVAGLHVATAARPSTGVAGPLQMERLEFVQHLLAAHGKRQIAVAGSLGKSTAAAVLHQVLAPTDPSAYIGADVPGLLCGATLTGGPWAVVEACEYRDAYSALAPEIAVALNITSNHEDHFGAGTGGFARSLAGFLVAHPLRLAVMPADVADLLQPHLREAGTAPDIDTLGDDADWTVTILDANPRGTVFVLDHHGRGVGTWTVPAPGRHLVTAAACAAITSLHLGLTPADSADALRGFRLPLRRMSTMHTDANLVVVDDNARQPDQIAALIQGLRQAHPGRHLVLAVAPWGTRNKRDLDAWAPALAEADTVWVLPVGPAAVPGGEDPDADVRLANLIRLDGTPAYVATPGVPLRQLLPAGRQPGPLLVTTAGYDASLTAFTGLHDQVIGTFADKAGA
ncbi:glutamate ligase domain-containing protein [Kitasatospora indigofera]|uniref:glutamate ligase domain-containing protein n=1 Tax=Kitasatospora indigofera TaxID=67307 RepID=UPI0036AFF48F